MSDARRSYASAMAVRTSGEQSSLAQPSPLPRVGGVLRADVAAPARGARTSPRPRVPPPPGERERGERERGGD